MEPMNEQQAMSRLVASLELAWSKITEVHPDVPLAVVTVASGEGQEHGHFAHGAWEMQGARLPEVQVAGESLSRGAEFILKVLLHEGAHGLGASREIKNTSRQGRYHNREFRKLAEEMGLVFPANGEGKVKADKVFGWAFPEMPPEMVDTYRVEVDALQVALDGFYRLTKTQAASEDEKENSTVAAVCQCRETARGIKMVPGPRRIRVSRSVLDLGGIACEVCGALFEEETK